MILHRILPVFATIMLVITALGLQSCTVVKVVDVAASTTIGAAKGAAKVTGKAVGAAIPDGDDKDKKHDEDD